MESMIPEVDDYLVDGCGRCDHYKTPQCKVHSWTEILIELRRIILECGLVEEFKWSQPCYTFQRKNVLIVTAFKEFACISFFKGALIGDTNNMLITPGKSSQAARQIRFTTVSEVINQEQIIKTYVHQAIEVEKAGLKIQFKKNPEPLPDELQWEFDENPDLKQAFEALTPGRQRGYILHFSQPKNSSTRTARIEKCTPKILNGEGMHDYYKSKK